MRRPFGGSTLQFQFGYSLSKCCPATAVAISSNVQIFEYWETLNFWFSVAFHGVSSDISNMAFVPALSSTNSAAKPWERGLALIAPMIKRASLAEAGRGW